jgi:hypothetical protein
MGLAYGQLIGRRKMLRRAVAKGANGGRGKEEMAEVRENA